MPEPISHAEMIAEINQRLAYLDDMIRSGYGEATSERDAMRAIRDHLERTQWRDIATAPKDGSAILIWQPGITGFDRGAVTAEYDDWRYAIGYWRPGGGWGNRNYSTVEPTHWQPLPFPPSPETP